PGRAPSPPPGRGRHPFRSPFLSSFRSPFRSAPGRRCPHLPCSRAELAACPAGAGGRPVM
ncbi:hypothetical protein, partial [Kitasatospora sp. NPDC057198]|uniref:hypothetical protein n=1 Tax=Kitasatospora sp. NPDC057198 TaxID=3346046 RepID=UPI003627AD19